MLGLVCGRARARVLITALFVIVCGVASQALGDTSSEWINTAGSDWTDPTSWSTNPYYPNNGNPTGTDYQAVIDQQGSGPYTITFGSSDSAAVDELTLSSTNATVYQSGGTLDAGSINISGGTYDMAGGVLSDGTITRNGGGTFNLLGGTLDDMTFSGFSVLIIPTNQALFTVTNGLNFGGGTLRLSGLSDNINFDGASQSLSDITIQGRPSSTQNPGNLNVGGPNSTGPVTLTINSNAEVTGETDIQDGYDQNYNMLYNETCVNNGTLLANLSGRALTVDTEYFYNNTTVTANSGSDFELYSPFWTNEVGASITCSGATLDIETGGAGTNSGTISVSGAVPATLITVSFTNYGTLVVNGADFEDYGTNYEPTDFVNGAGGVITVNGGTLDLSSDSWANHGLVSVSGGATIYSYVEAANTGTFLLLGNSTLNNYTGFDVGEGTFEGNGTIIGSLTFDSDPSHYLVSIGGTGQGVSYDFTSVTGAVSLGGDLEILFANGFQSSITPSEVFTILQGSSISGSFLNVVGGRVETDDGYGSFLVQLLAGPDDTEELELSDFESTPEPGGLALLSGVVLCSARRRRKRILSPPSTRRTRSWVIALKKSRRYLRLESKIRRGGRSGR